MIRHLVTVRLGGKVHLRTLQIFCSVAQHGSFSRAAVALGLTQSAASQAVNHLEDHLGIQLIDRSNRPLALTHAGRVYRDGAQKLVHDFQALEDEVRAMGRRLVGQVSLASIYSVGLSYLPDATTRFRQLHPEVEVTVEYTKPSRVAKLVASGEVDLGLVSYPDEAKGVGTTPWQEEQMRLICAPDHALSNCAEVRVTDLHGLSMVAFETGLAIRRDIDRYFGARGVRPRIAMEFDNIHSLIRAVQDNQGFGIMPEAAVRRETATGSLRIIPCADLDIRRPLGIAWRRGGRLGPAAREFAALLLGHPLEDGYVYQSEQGDGPAKVPEAVP